MDGPSWRELSKTISTLVFVPLCMEVPEVCEVDGQGQEDYAYESRQLQQNAHRQKEIHRNQKELEALAAPQLIVTFAGKPHIYNGILYIVVCLNINRGT